MGINEIHDDVIYNRPRSYYVGDTDGDGKFDNFTENSHSNAIDIYLFPHDHIIGGGLASGIPSTALLLGGNIDGLNLVTSHILTHEIGHCLGLYHTYHGLCGGNICKELVNGTNCATCGDRVCDTPPDPQAAYTAYDPITCLWNGTTCNNIPNVDANGHSYNPDNHLYMASIPPPCMQYHTPGQVDRMHLMIETSAVLQNVLVPNELTISNLNVTSGQDILYNVPVSITVQNNIFVQSGAELTLRAGSRVTLLPGFTAHSGSNFTAEADYQCNTLINNSARPDKNDNGQSQNVTMDKFPFPKKGFNIFPNPVEDLLYITYDRKEAIRISIMDFQGRKIKDDRLILLSGSIDIIDLLPGIYILHYETSEGDYGTEKFIKK